MSDDQKNSAGAVPADGAPLLRSIVLGLLLAVLWLLLSGFFEPMLLGLGLLSVVIAVWVGRRMDLIDHEGVPFHISLAVVGYLPWLLLEIVKANLDVARRVIAPHPDISPTMFDAPASQKTDLGQVIYANSITLTPGTVSVDLDPGVIRVHALSRDGADGVLEGEMDRRVTEVEGLSGRATP